MTLRSFETPQEDRWFEDYRPGEVYEFPPILVSEDDIVAFARQFDPQPYHADPLAAGDYPFGGVIASGWHTGSLMMRFLVEHVLATVSALPSPGVDELRWLTPLCAGDRLRMRLRILSARPSESKPDRGVVHFFVEMLNQDDQPVMTVKPIGVFKRRMAG